MAVDAVEIAVAADAAEIAVALDVAGTAAAVAVAFEGEERGSYPRIQVD